MTDNDVPATENKPATPSAIQPKQIPYTRDGVAVFDKMIPDGEGGKKHIYELADDAKGLKYVGCPSSILGYNLTKDDVIDLYQNRTLVVTATKKEPKAGEDPTYDLLLGSTGVESTPGKNPAYTNRRLNVVTGFPLRQKVEDGTPEQKRDAPIEAYLVSEKEGGKRDVKMYRSVGPKKSPVILELGDAYRLLAKASFVRNGCETTLESLKEGTPFKIATVKARILSQEEKAQLEQSQSQDQRPSRSL